MKGVALFAVAVLLVSAASAFVVVDRWQVYEDGHFHEFVENNVDLDVSGVQGDEIKIVFTIPELGIRESKGPYDPEQRRHAGIQKTILLPLDAEAGEYAIRMTITDRQGNKRVRHRIIEIK